MPNPLMKNRVREEPSLYGDEVATLEGVLERITFHNAENGYSVVKVSPAGAKGRAKDDVITVLGSFSNPIVGESLRCWGQWVKHPQYGPQFKMDRYETIRPATAAAIEKYLGSGMVKGIGPVMAKRIVEKFGETALDVIEEDPEKLTGVSGIGEKRVGMIRAAWEEQKEVRAIMLFLQGHGVSPTFAVKIYRHYKERSIEVVEQNPYQLATDIWGIGFKSADKIAQNIGIAKDAPERLQAGLVYVLNEQMEGAGHCFLPEDDLIRAACAILGTEQEPVEQAPVERALEELIAQERLVAETVEMVGVRDTAIYTPAIHTTEKAVAERVNTLLTSPWRSRPKPAEIDAAVEGIKGADALSAEQQQAVRKALSEPLLVLTGGPGTGKTTSTRVIVAALEKMGRRLQLASPTGRAAKRLAEVTGKEAKTIHRLLEFDPEKRGFKHGPGEPLDLDVLIIDEASMLDLVLTHHVLRAVPDGAQVIFVGDVDQLPSVGPGNVLADLINSGRVPVSRLTQVFRQAAESRIITNAHRMNQGRMPDLPPPSAIQQGADCVLLEVDEAEEIPQKVAGVVAKSLPKLGYGRDDITVLTPMQRGSVGARNLNEILQSVLNPPRPDKAETKRGPVVFRVGDRVMQRVNNYDKGVFNGDVGKILAIDAENQTLAVAYPEGPVEYDFADVDQLTHAFSMSIHKCIRAGETVSTRDCGLVPIEELSVGDVIQTGVGGDRRVLARVNTGRRPVVRITTRAGYRIDVSEEHPILVSDGSAPPRFVTARDLRTGQFACISREPVDPAPPVALPAFPPGGRRADISVPSHLDEDLAWLLGVIVGDGSYRDRKDGTVDLTSQDPDVLERYRAILEGYHLRDCSYHPAGRKAARLYVVSRPFREWLLDLGLAYCTARDKRVPPLLFRASARIKAAFLRGLYDADGSAGTGTCRLITSSAELAREVQQLLLSTGIVASISRSGLDAYCVAVSGTSLPVFAERIGFSIGYKQERLAALLEKAGTIGKTYRDFVPHSPLIVEDVARSLRAHWGHTRGIKGKGLHSNGGRMVQHLISRARSQQKGLSYQNLRDLESHLCQVGATVPDSLRGALDSHLYFDPIVSIERTGEEAEMYDIEVEGIHSFVARGFVCHNSQGSEYPACVICLHTQHYMMLARNLVYTALTRAKKIAVFIGSKRAIAMAVRNKRAVPRNTRLAERLQRLVDESAEAGRSRARAPKPSTPPPPLPGRLL